MTRMSLFLAKSRRQMKNGTIYEFYVLRKNHWDAERKATRQEYIAYVGKEKRITKEKAMKIEREKGISLDELKTVEGLEIIE